MDNALAQYLNYCNATSATATQSIPTSATSWLTSHESLPTIPTSWLTYHETLTQITASNLEMAGTTIAESTVIFISTTMTSTIPAYFFHASLQSLVSSYIPPAVFSDLAASAASAASMASITGDATSLIYAALEDESRPPWFSSAVPSTYTAEMNALETSISDLRATLLSTTSAKSSVEDTNSSGMLIASLTSFSLI